MTRHSLSTAQISRPRRSFASTLFEVLLLYKHCYINKPSYNQGAQAHDNVVTHHQVTTCGSSAGWLRLRRMILVYNESLVTLTHRKGDLIQEYDSGNNGRGPQTQINSHENPMVEIHHPELIGLQPRRQQSDYYRLQNTQEQQHTNETGPGSDVTIIQNTMSA